MDATRKCTRCEGTGITKGYSSETYSSPDRPCYSCDGKGEFSAPDMRALLQLCKGRKGLRSARPKYARTVEVSRAYYIWRLARFHGGVDMRLPMGADLDTHGDPYKEELDACSEAVARACFGSDMRAATRWYDAFHGTDVHSDPRFERSKVNEWDQLACEVLGRSAGKKCTCPDHQLQRFMSDHVAVIKVG